MRPAITFLNIQLSNSRKSTLHFYHGSYESIPDIRDRLIAYAKEHGFSLKGTCRHIYLEGPPAHTDPSKFITQVALLVE